MNNNFIYFLGGRGFSSTANPRGEPNRFWQWREPQQERWV